MYHKFLRFTFFLIWFIILKIKVIGRVYGFVNKKHCVRIDVYSIRFFSVFNTRFNLKEETKDFASQVFPPGLFMVHNSSTRGQHNISEIRDNKFSFQSCFEYLLLTEWRCEVYSPKLTTWEKVVGPLLNVCDCDVEPGWNDTTFVQPSGKVYNNLSAPVVVNNFKFSNVTCNWKLLLETSAHYKF